MARLEVQKMRIKGRVNELTVERHALYAKLEELGHPRWWQVRQCWRKRVVRGQILELTALILDYLVELKQMQ